MTIAIPRMAWLGRSWMRARYVGSIPCPFDINVGGTSFTVAEGREVPSGLPAEVYAVMKSQPSDWDVSEAPAPVKAAPAAKGAAATKSTAPAKRAAAKKKK